MGLNRPFCRKHLFFNDIFNKSTQENQPDCHQFSNTDAPRLRNLSAMLPVTQCEAPTVR